ncbi:hypothetical protein LZ31DRAFT_601374 [Colletotrichum somersetense]|nr:hypothetical protein LZ31DRAFT_601374 [Colletotrichum somersetense]
MLFLTFTHFLVSATVTTAQAEAPSLSIAPSAPVASLVPAGIIDWRTVNCSGVIVDAKALPNKRWEAAGATEALHEVLAAWRNYTRNPDEVKFEFSEFVSWFFGGPEHWRCSEIFDVPCSTTLVCEDTKYPAGHLILNSFSKLHLFQNRYFEALGMAQQAIQSEIDFFAESFSVPPPRDPKKDQTTRILINVAYGLIGIAQAYMNNFFIFAEPVEQAAGQMISQVWRSQLSTTLSYSIFTSWAIGKDYMLPGQNPTPAYGTIGALMGDVFNNWKASQTAYVKHIFSPNDTETENFLIAALDNGFVGSTPDDINTYDISTTLQKLFYPRFMVSVWQTRKWSKRPFVLKTNLACHMEEGKRDSSLWPFLPDSDHARAAACYNNRLFYLVDIRSEGVKLTTDFPSIRPDVFKSKHWPLTALFGAETMDGIRYGGVTKEDIVAAAYNGYVAGGYMNNVFKPNYTDVSPQSQAQLWSGLGNRSPGFVEMSLCENLYTIVGNVVHGSPDQHPSWPCAPLNQIKPLK